MREVGRFDDSRYVGRTGGEDGEENDILHDVERRVKSRSLETLGRDRTEKLLDGEARDDELVLVRVLHVRLGRVRAIGRRLRGRRHL